MRSLSEAKSAPNFAHGVFLAFSLGIISWTLASLETPLPEGAYRAERGYQSPRDSCPARIEIADVRIAGGTIEFESGGAVWSGTINEKTGVVRIETAGIEPRPNSDLHIRGHYAKAQLFSSVCGLGYFRVLR